MPKYTFAEMGAEAEEKVSAMPAPDNYQRMLYLPVSKEIIDSLDIDAKISVMLVGKVTGLEAREGEDYSSHEVKLELKSIETSPIEGNEFSALVDDE